MSKKKPAPKKAPAKKKDPTRAVDKRKAAAGRSSPTPDTADPVQTPCQREQEELLSVLSGLESWGDSLIVLVENYRDEAAALAELHCGRDPQGACCDQYAQLRDSLRGYDEAIQGFHADCGSIRTALEALCGAEGWQAEAAGIQDRLGGLNNSCNILFNAMTQGRTERNRLAGECPADAEAPPVDATEG